MKNKALYIVVGILTLLMSSILADQLTVLEFNSGRMIASAERIVEGDIIYKDFWSKEAFGQYYLTSFLISNFSDSFYFLLLIQKYLTILFSSFLLLNIIHAHIGKFSLIPYVLGIIILDNFLYLADPRLFFLLLTSLIVYCVLKYKRTNLNYYIYISGALSVLSMYFKHDLAIYLMGAYYQSFFWIMMGFDESNDKWYVKAVRNLLLALKFYIPVAIGIIIFLICVPQLSLYEMYQLFIEFNFTTFKEYFNKPFPSLISSVTIQEFIFASLYYFGILMMLLSVLIVIMRIMKKEMKSGNYEFWIILTLFNTAINIMNPAWVKSDVYEIAPVLFFTVFLLAYNIRGLRILYTGKSFST